MKIDVARTVLAVERAHYNANHREERDAVIPDAVLRDGIDRATVEDGGNAHNGSKSGVTPQQAGAEGARAVFPPDAPQEEAQIGEGGEDKEEDARNEAAPHAPAELEPAGELRPGERRELKGGVAVARILRGAAQLEEAASKLDCCWQRAGWKRRGGRRHRWRGGRRRGGHEFPRAGLFDARRVGRNVANADEGGAHPAKDVQVCGQPLRAKALGGVHPLHPNEERKHDAPVEREERQRQHILPRKIGAQRQARRCVARGGEEQDPRTHALEGESHERHAEARSDNRDPPVRVQEDDLDDERGEVLREQREHGQPAEVRALEHIVCQEAHALGADEAEHNGGNALLRTDAEALVELGGRRLVVGCGGIDRGAASDASDDEDEVDQQGDHRHERKGMALRREFE
eukprot:scaffold14402_cov30-Tisochrysis_lutea.AAC.1